MEDPKAYLRADRSPSPTDIGWVAGFLEGEGSFKTNNGPQGCEVVTAPQVQKEPLENLRSLVGGSIGKRKHSNPKHNDYWEWSISGARARGLIFTIFTLLSTRRRLQARKALVAKGPISSVPGELIRSSGA